MFNYYFNSIKVRLEPNLKRGLPTATIYFNSIKVRLEHMMVIGVKHIYWNFNSIKVRLELRLYAKTAGQLT